MGEKLGQFVQEVRQDLWRKPEGEYTKPLGAAIQSTAIMGASFILMSLMCWMVMVTVELWIWLPLPSDVRDTFLLAAGYGVIGIAFTWALKRMLKWADDAQKVGK